MMSDIYIEPRCGDDEEYDDPDCCEHGDGFDCNCAGCEADPAEMVEQFIAEGEA